MNLGATLMLFAAAGWSGAAVMRYGREELERTGAMHRTAWARLSITVPLLFLVAAVLLALKAAGALPEEYTWTFVWLTLALGVFIVAADQMNVLLDAAGCMRISAIGLSARQATMAIGLGALLMAGAGGSPLVVAGLTVAVSAALSVAMAIPVRRLALWPARIDRAQFRRVLTFSLPLVAFTASQYGMRSVDILVLRHYEPWSDVGIYALAYQGYLMLQQVGTVATVVLVPLFVSLREAGRSELVGRYFQRLLPPATLAVSSAAGMLAPLIVLAVPLAFGDNYADAARPLAVLMGGIALFCVAGLIAPVMLLFERTRETAVINVVALAVNVTGDLILVGVLGMGVAGPAVATVASLAVIVGGYFVVARRDLGLAPRVRPAVLAPLIAGILPAVLAPAAIGVPLGLAAAALSTALVLWRVTLFSAADADLVMRLNLPASVQRRLAAGIRRLAH